MSAKWVKVCNLCNKLHRAQNGTVPRAMLMHCRQGHVRSPIDVAFHKYSVVWRHRAVSLAEGAFPVLEATGTQISSVSPRFIASDVTALRFLIMTSTLSVEDAFTQAGDSLEAAISALWHLDANRLCPSIDYRLNVQSRTEYCSHDAASQPFVSNVSDDVWTRPAYGLLRRLQQLHS